MVKRNNWFLAISLLTLISFLVLFYLRSLDDNRLTSWQWAFEGVDVARFYLVLVGGLIAAFFLSRVSPPDRYAAAMLFFSSFAAASFFWGEPEVIVDASRYFTQAKHLEVYGAGYFVREWGKSIPAWTDLPLVPILYGLIFRFCGELRLYIEIFTALLSSSTVVLTYLMGKELWDEDTGFCAGVLLMGVPYLFIQIPLMLVDVPTMFFLLLATFVFTRAMASGGMGMAAASSVCICLAFYSKYSTWPMLSIFIVIMIVYLKAARRNRGVAPVDGSGPISGKSLLRRSASIIAAASILIGIIFLYKFDVFSDQMRLLKSYQGPGLKRWGESFFSTFLFQVHPFITVASLFSLWVAFRKRDIRYAIIAWLPLLVVVFQVRRIRYIVPLFPFVALTASYGLQQIKEREVRRFLVLCVLLTSLAVALFAYLPFAKKMSAVNLKNAGAFLDTIDEGAVEVFTLSPAGSSVNPAVAVPLIDLFTKKRIIYNYHPDSRKREDIERSPLRFTWEYRNPGYYADRAGPASGTAVLVISSGADEDLPPCIERRIKNCRLAETFGISEGVFEYRTIVKVYHRCQ